MSNDFTWKAIYNDGRFLHQFNGQGAEAKYTDIDRSKLVFFDIFKSDKLVFRLHLGDGKRLIYRRRVTLPMSGGAQCVVLLVGWQMLVKGVNVQSISYIHENGLIEFAGAFKGETLFASPVFLDCEKLKQKGVCEVV